tara:strand:- start:4738 stop:6393 length:1656 start_codon:yes stop_codon:yes gene_type:complete
MKKLLLVLVFTAMGMFKGQSQALVQTYVDRCTGQVNVYSVPMNGSTVVAFYNRSRVFTAQEFQNGTLQAWLEETYLWWTSLSPCSTAVTGVNNTTQQTQQTTQQATEAAQNATQAATQQVPDVPPTPTATPPVQETISTPDTSTTPDTSATTTAPDTSSTPDTQGAGSDASTGTDQTATGGSEASTSDTQADSQQTDTSSGSENTTTEETTSTESSDSSESTETSESQESTDESSTEETSGEAGDDEGNSNDGEASEEETEAENVEEESTEEESTEEESTEEESTEEEAEEEESTEEEAEEEESEEEETEEEETEEEEEEEEEEEKKALPIVLSANVLSQQSPTGEYSTAAQFGFSQSSLLGDRTYGATLMAWSNGQQFMLNFNYSKVNINDKGRVNRVYSAALGGAKMFSTYMATMNHSFVFLGKKGSATGLAFGTSVTSVELDVRGGLVYYDDISVSTSLTGFYTKPIMYSPRLTFSPMIAVSSPFANVSLFDLKNINFNKDLIFIGGTSLNYKLTKRFNLNIGATFIEATIPQFPTLANYMIGGKMTF